MFVLGFDLSLNSTGVCRMSSKPFGAECWCSDKIEGSLYQKIKYIDLFTQKVLDNHGEIVIIGIEAPVPNSQMSGALYPLFMQLLRHIDEKWHKFVVCPTNTSVKSLIIEQLGHKGKLLKSDIVKAAKDNLGSQVVGRLKADAADAFFIAKTALAFYEVFTGARSKALLSPKEKHVFLSEEVNKRGQKKGIIHRPDEMFFDWR